MLMWKVHISGMYSIYGHKLDTGAVLTGTLQVNVNRSTMSSHARHMPIILGPIPYGAGQMVE